MPRYSDHRHPFLRQGFWLSQGFARRHRARAARRCRRGVRGSGSEEANGMGWICDCQTAFDSKPAMQCNAAPRSSGNPYIYAPRFCCRCSTRSELLRTASCAASMPPAFHETNSTTLGSPASSKNALSLHTVQSPSCLVTHSRGSFVIPVGMRSETKRLTSILQNNR